MVPTFSPFCLNKVISYTVTPVFPESEKPTIQTLGTDGVLAYSVERFCDFDIFKRRSTIFILQWHTYHGRLVGLKRRRFFDVAEAYVKLIFEKAQSILSGLHPSGVLT
jgi:predicted NUDIX family NTP pyrophosphohydrolase